MHFVHGCIDAGAARQSNIREAHKTILLNATNLDLALASSRFCCLCSRFEITGLRGYLCSAGELIGLGRMISQPATGPGII